jgi:hypothetical protein
MKLKKKFNKKITRVNPGELAKPWDMNNFIENKQKKHRF